MPVPARKIVTPPAAIDFSAIRQELQIPAHYPPEAVAEAAAVGSAVVHTAVTQVDDATDIPFVTVDPPGSMDLDQAVHLDRSGDGYLVRYAIADVSSFVAPDGPLARE
ncbi:MAG TPA: RNB domain-containing ribonuclease, partial [Nakamurella sp.]|nr:RNB domain-containing ribonuclease [Nakamurella sp.]